jgi:hypothetical protein
VFFDIEIGGVPSGRITMEVTIFPPRLQVFPKRLRISLNGPKYSLRCLAGSPTHCATLGGKSFKQEACDGLDCSCLKCSEYWSDN